MSPQPCDLVWMAEAGDDGRVTDGQRTAFYRHAQNCEACASASMAVARLREAMTSIPEPAHDDFHHRRQRQRLMARANERQTTIAWPSLTRRCMAISVSLGVVIFASIGAWTALKQRTAGGESAPRYEMTALEGAVWTNEEIGGTARIVLSRGSAAFHVHHLRAGQRFLVTTPDAEVEVRGTRFVVDVEEGETRYVVVMEGKVAIRRVGAREQLLLGGQRWDAPVSASSVALPPPPTLVPSQVLVTRPPPPPISRVVDAPGSISIDPGQRPTGHLKRAIAVSSPTHPSRSSITPTRSPIQQPSVASANNRPPAPKAEREPTEGSEPFSRGVRAFRAGRYQEAEAAWDVFLAGNANDPRTEDAAFLSAVGRSRLGDERGAATLARRYLAHFPRGLRRREAEALIHRVPQNQTENQ